MGQAVVKKPRVVSGNFPLSRQPSPAGSVQAAGSDFVDVSPAAVASRASPDASSPSIEVARDENLADVPQTAETLNAATLPIAEAVPVTTVTNPSEANVDADPDTL